MSTNKIEQFIDSREVAEMVGKQHKNLLADVRGYVDELTELKIQPSDFFRESTYKDCTGRTLPCYQVTKKGCEFIAHKLTGIKGTEFTARYINRFHEMEEALAGRGEEAECIISTQELAAVLKRKQCKVCYRIDSLLQMHPEYQAEFIPGSFRNVQGREFRTYDLTREGLRIFIRLLEAVGNRNNVNTAKGIQRIKDMYPGVTGEEDTGSLPEVSSYPRTGLMELQKAEAALDMFEQCYLGQDLSEFDDEDRERFDAALCLLHDQVKLAVAEVKEACYNER